VDIRVDSRPSIELDGGEGATEMESHIGSDGSAKDGEEGEEGHNDGDKRLPDERAEEIKSSG